MQTKSRIGPLLCSFLLFANTAAQAADLFSYTALQLPFEAKAARPWYQVIQTQQDWEQFYAGLIPPTFDVTADGWVAPVIDFANYTIIVGGLGGATGPWLVMDKVVDVADTVYVNVGKVSPGANCAVAQIIHYPTLAILVRKTTKNIQVYLEPLVFNCG